MMDFGFISSRILMAVTHISWGLMHGQVMHHPMFVARGKKRALYNLALKSGHQILCAVSPLGT